MDTGMVFNIQKMSIHDGPGIRTTVFLKGCPLSCIWCANPESQHGGRELACFSSRCVGCGYCAEVCPKGIIEKTAPFDLTDRSECDLCGVCVKECCTGAKDLIGTEYTVEDLMEEILADKPFYDSSGGGVTFSGGEPFSSGEFLLQMLKACKAAGIHTAVETSGFADWELIEACAPYMDLVFMDVKHMDDKRHEELTGVSNEAILENLTRLSKIHSNIIARIPVIPGLNNSEENICKTAIFVKELGIGRLELLPYHNLGEVKYGQLGKVYELSELKNPTEEYMHQLVSLAQSAADEVMPAETAGKACRKLTVEAVKFM